MYAFFQNAPERYITGTPDNDKQGNLNNLYENETEQSPQTLSEPLPVKDIEPLQTQNTPAIPNDPASTQTLQTLPPIDDEIQNHLTINKETDTSVFLLSNKPHFE